MPANQQTYVNGNRWSFVNLSVDMAGLQIPGLGRAFKSINYKASQDPGVVQANQITIVGRTAGYGTASGSFEIYLWEWNLFTQGLTQQYSALTGVPKPPIMAVDFDMAITYDINSGDTTTDYLIGCRITDIDSSNQQGNDATAKSCTLSIARLKLNGIDAFADPLL